MEKIVNGITFKEDSDYLLSKYKINDFLENYKEYLKENNWDEVFKDVLYPKDSNVDVDAKYTPSVIYTLLVLDSNFLEYLTKIPNYMFLDCPFIISITLPVSIDRIPQGAFQECNSLTSISIPNSVKEIGESAFAYCDSLKSITIPSSVEEIRNYAFYGCTSLTSITLPNSVKKIREKAFQKCTSLKTFTCSKDLQFDAEKIGLSSSVEIIKV